MNKSIVAKIRIAFSRKHALATLLGILHGAPIPVGVFSIMHIELNNDVWNAKALIVLAGLLYSAKTVYKWGKQVFRNDDGSADTIKALGFVGMIEGMMVASSMMWLNIVGLVILVLVNAIASGVSMAMDAEAEEPVTVVAPAAVEPSPEPVEAPKPPKAPKKRAASTRTRKAREPKGAGSGMSDMAN